MSNAICFLVLLVYMVIICTFTLFEDMKYDGRVVLKNYKLRGATEIYRDKYGIPYIKTTDRGDSMFGLGYVHA